MKDSLKAFVAAHVWELVRREQEAEVLRDQLLAGASSPVVGLLDAGYVQSLRERVRRGGAR